MVEGLYTGRSLEKALPKTKEKIITKGVARFWRGATAFLLFAETSFLGCATSAWDNRDLLRPNPIPATRETPVPTAPALPALPYSLIVDEPECFPVPNLTQEYRDELLQEAKNKIAVLEYLTNSEIINGLKSQKIEIIRDIISGKISPNDPTYDQSLCDMLDPMNPYRFIVDANSGASNVGINSNRRLEDVTIGFNNSDLRREYGFALNFDIQFSQLYSDTPTPELKELSIVFATPVFTDLNNCPDIDPNKLDSTLELWLQYNKLTDVTWESNQHEYWNGGTQWSRIVQGRVLKGETPEYRVEAGINTFGQVSITLQTK